MKLKQYVKPIFLSTSLMILQACASGKLAHFKQFYSTKLNASYRILAGPAEEQGQGKVTFIVEVKYKNLLFVQSDSIFLAELRLTFAARSANSKKPAQLIDRHKIIRVSSFTQVISDDRYVRLVEPLILEPDEYITRIMISDANAKTLGLFSRKVDLRQKSEELSISDPVLLQDSLATLDEKNIIPFDQKIFSKPVYAFFQVAGLTPGKNLQITYDIRDRQKKTFFHDRITARCSGEMCDFWLRIAPENIALGTSTLHITAAQDQFADSTKIRIYSQYNYSNKKFQNIEVIIEPMRLIMPKKEWKKLRDAKGEEQNKLFNAFWDRRNPQENSTTNSLLEEFFYRVEETNQRFHFGSIDGWKTDRGRIYLVNGPPDHIRHQYSQTRQVVYEIWEYREQGITYYFRDDYGNGDYRLMTGVF